MDRQHALPDRCNSSRQVPVRNRRSRQRRCSLVEKFQQHLWRMGNDTRSQTDESQLPRVGAVSGAGRRVRAGSEEAQRDERFRRGLAPARRSRRLHGASRIGCLRRPRSRHPRQWRSGDESRPADPRRRLHGGRARCIHRQGKRTRGRTVRNLSIQGTQGGLQRLGAGARIGPVRHIPAFDEHLPRHAARHDLRRLPLRAIRADLRQQEHAPHRFLHAL